ncbi:DUF1761 domain-containing protein [Candidatus Woesearchaeota archaeon]|nr:DUF1761 domain-containing protein [Candidatus Woesearchaeota archaeon]
MPELISAIIAGVVFYIIGAFWYSPLLFGKQWMKLSGIKPVQMSKEGVWKSYLGGFLASLITAIVLWLVITGIGISSILESMKMAVFLWIGFIAATSLNNVIWGGKKVQLYILENGYYLAGMLAMSAIIAF